MVDQNSSWTTTIPASVPSGPYLIRFETIALHSLPAVSTLTYIGNRVKNSATRSKSTQNARRSTSSTVAPFSLPRLSLSRSREHTAPVTLAVSPHVLSDGYPTD
jgi:hypothetical protein